MVKSQKMQWPFSKYIFFLGEIATNGRIRYFHIAENASSEQRYVFLDDVVLMRMTKTINKIILTLSSQLRKKLYKPLVHRTRR